MTYFRIKPAGLVPEFIPPSPRWDRIDGYQSATLEETTDVNDPDRPSLASLTDAHVRALLALDADAVFYLGAVINTPGIRWGRDEWRRALLAANAIRSDIEHGDDPLPLGLALAEAQRIAEGLYPIEVQHLEFAADTSGERHTLDARVVAVLGQGKLVQAGRDDEGRYRLDITPAGRLVLALRERSQLEREAGSRLPDSDAACERWESEKDERGRSR